MTPTLGAVSYLNMIPFFACSDTPVELFATPRLLNDSIRAGAVDAGCMSAIAGVRAGFEPTEPFMGVAAAQTVGSVFVEPVLETAADKTFWHQFYESVSGGLARLKEQDPFSPQEEKVQILSSGASEQSEWLARMLLQSQGIRSEVSYDFEIEERVNGESSQFQGARDESVRRLRLFIGDQALLRSWAYPLSELERWDLAEMWRRFAGSPAIFALWYCRRLEHKSEAGRLIFTNLENWLKLSQKKQLFLALDVLEKQKNALLCQISVKDIEKNLSDYLSNLSFILDNDFQTTFDSYRYLYSRFS